MKKFLPILSLFAIALSGCKVINSGYHPSSGDTSPNTGSNTNTGTSTDTGTSDTNTNTQTTDTSTERTGTVEVKLAGINDFHGHIEEEGNIVGLAKMATYIKSKKSEGALVLNSGDMWQETFLASECKGTIISKAFRTSGVDVNTLGNHDFDWGVDAIRLNEQAEYFGELTLGANIMSYPKNGNSWTKADLGKEYKTFVLNEGTDKEVKVGVVGIIGKDQLTSITSKFVEDYVFLEHNQVIKDVSTKLRKQEGCDIVVASCHTPANQLDDSLFDKDSNGKRKYIDAAFCAHDHSLYSSSVNGAPVIEAQSYGKYGAEVSLTFNLDTGKVEDSSYKNVQLSSLKLKEDPEVKADVDALVKECGEKGDTVYGTVTSYFSKDNIGRWQAQCAAEKASELGVNVDYVIVNSARAYLQSGTVNHYKMYETHPFVNDLYVVRVSMSDVYGEIYNYSNPFYRVTKNALEDNRNKYVTILVYNYLLFHVSVNNDTYEKKYNYFYSLNTSGEVPTLFTDNLGNKLNVLDLTIKDLQKKGTIDPANYEQNSWRNSKDLLTAAQ
ncbi:MAG: metallophosphoesterase [Bacilli bacterium]|nr:metallophosphoesterase [Bacilli bacterium]